MDRNMSPANLRERLWRAHALEPLRIGLFTSMSVERYAQEFRHGSDDVARGHMATGIVHFSGSGLLWSHQPHDRFDSELNGKVGKSTVRILDLLDQASDLTLFEEHVVERLAAAERALADQEHVIAAVNDRISDGLDTFLHGAAAELDRLREGVKE